MVRWPSATETAAEAVRKDSNKTRDLQGVFFKFGSLSLSLSCETQKCLERTYEKSAFPGAACRRVAPRSPPRVL